MENNNDKVVLNDADKEVAKTLNADASAHSHHSSEHTHHSHHSGRRKKKRRHRFSSKQIKSFYIISISVLLIVIAVLASLMIFSGTKPVNTTTESSGTDKKSYAVSDGIVFSSPFFDDSVKLVDSAVSDYISLDVDVNADLTEVISFDDIDVSKLEVPVTFNFDVVSLPKNVYVKQFVLSVSLSDEPDGALVYEISSDVKSFEVKHLYVNKQYVYSVTVRTSAKVDCVYSGTFKTADTPRLINIEGLYNVRDIGNWETIYGKRIKQGMIIRGTEVDGVVCPSYKITDEGLTDMMTSFGIRSDVDLRNPSDLSSVVDTFGKSVNHVFFPVNEYAGIFTESQKSIVKDIFSFLSVSSNYPVYMHCTYGQDRTGTICYLVEALLGVSEDDLIKEYGLTVFEHNNLQRGMILTVQEGIDKYEGDSFAEKTEAYLLDCGVTESQIESIRSIMLEK